MRLKAFLPFLPYAVISVIHSLLIIFDLPGRGYETKQLLMPALALAAVWSMWGVRPWPRGAMALILSALAASWVGDGAGLFFPDLPRLPMMILFFALAHLAYIALFVWTPGFHVTRGLAKWSAVYVLWWGITVAVVGPHAGALLIPLAVYGVVLGGTAATATRLGAVVACGGAFFLASDSFIAFNEFLGMPQWAADLLIMPTYELGQGLIVFGVVSLLRANARASVHDVGVSGRVSSVSAEAQTRHQ